MTSATRRDHHDERKLDNRGRSTGLPVFSSRKKTRRTQITYGSIGTSPATLRDDGVLVFVPWLLFFVPFFPHKRYCIRHPSTNEKADVRIISLCDYKDSTHSHDSEYKSIAQAHNFGNAGCTFRELEETLGLSKQIGEVPGHLSSNFAK